MSQHSQRDSTAPTHRTTPRSRRRLVLPVIAASAVPTVAVGAPAMASECWGHRSGAWPARTWHGGGATPTVTLTPAATPLTTHSAHPVVDASSATNAPSNTSTG